MLDVHLVVDRRHSFIILFMIMVFLAFAAIIIIISTG